jgi:hypothetical protein
MTVLALKTDLFPDAGFLETALAAAFGAGVHLLDLTRPGLKEADWDRILDALLAAEHIITL